LPCSARQGMITPDRRGNTVYYSLVTTKIVTAYDIVWGVMAEKLQRSHVLTSII
jgi:hypothetical protein